MEKLFDNFSGSKTKTSSDYGVDSQTKKDLEEIFSQPIVDVLITKGTTPAPTNNKLVFQTPQKPSQQQISLGYFISAIFPCGCMWLLVFFCWI